STTVAFAAPERPSAIVAPEPAPDSTRKTIGFVALGGAAVFTGLTVFLGARTLAVRSGYYDGTSAGSHDGAPRTDVDAYNSAVTLRTWTSVAAVSAGVLGAVGVVLLATSPSGRAKANHVTSGAMFGPRAVDRLSLRF